ncbi:AMP-binding protein [Algibacter sp. AS12]|uniref:AMP-binding protein n=1 Tax=Algibacter sp. AS12 TaxID=3135773 RepID=UPI00398BA5CA
MTLSNTTDFNNTENTSLFELIALNENLSFINARDGEQYKLKDLILPLNDIVCTSKKLVFLYLDSGIKSILYYLTFLKSSHTIVLLSSSIKQELKENLEKEYLPYIIFDESRERINDYVFNTLDNDNFKTSFFKNELNNDNSIHNNCKILLSTSGTTGSPKFVKLSEENILQNALSIASYLPINKDDVAPVNLPLYYSYGLSVINSNAIAGGKIVCGLPDVLEKDFWKYLDEFKFTSIAGVPFIYEMLKRIGFLKKSYPSLKYISQAGGNLSENVKSAFYHYCESNAIRFFVMYGQTEATARISYVPDNMLAKKITSIGIPIKNGKLSIDKETGELLYSGPNVFGGYANKKEDLKIWENIITLKTGDLAIQDEDGFYFIKGRLKRFVKLFGNRVNLDEVESYLKASLNISLLACNGINDKFILVSYGIEGLDEAALKKQLFEKYKIHTSVVKFLYFDSLPITENGKINYKSIEATYLGK